MQYLQTNHPGVAGDQWAARHLPHGLLAMGPLGLALWQWATIAAVVAVAIVAGFAGGRLVRGGLGTMVRRTSTKWDDVVVDRVGTPLSGACALAAAALLLPLVGLDDGNMTVVYRFVRVAFGALLFWSAWRLVDVGRAALSESRWGRTAPASRALVPLGARIAKVIVASSCIVVLLSTLGYPVASLVAGLGIGGLAVALAAQKTVENLFGAFSIGLDQPFREGDFVKVDDFVGTVEAIGLRSTRFRTLDRTIVTLPNGKLADMRLESFAARDRLRLTAVVGLVYETTAAQMREVLSGFERVLRAHPLIWSDVVVVRFSELAASSLNIEVMAWFRTSDWGEFQRIRQEILLEFMDVVDAAGTSFAFPTTTVHMAEAGVAS